MGVFSWLAGKASGKKKELLEEVNLLILTKEAIETNLEARKFNGQLRLRLADPHIGIVGLVMIKKAQNKTLNRLKKLSRLLQRIVKEIELMGNEFEAEMYAKQAAATHRTYTEISVQKQQYLDEINNILSNIKLTNTYLKSIISKKIITIREKYFYHHSLSLDCRGKSHACRQYLGMTLLALENLLVRLIAAEKIIK